ncbi:uncharacterized protein IAS62_004693 [Cryptococcus decagattii]|uniref:Uncharacterized protein n=1 Tax=Cryptococcus decagattii TaxID=1859122 RepID=A0ABZ2B1J8_9TREE
MPLPPPLTQNRTKNNSLSEAPWSFSLTSRRNAPASAIVHIPPAPPNTLFAASTVSGDTVPPGMGGFSFGDWAPGSQKPREEFRGLVPSSPCRYVLPLETIM